MPRKLRATAASTQHTTAVETIKKKFTKEKLHKFVFGTRERQGLGQQIAVYGLLIIIGFIFIYPILYMISTSFMDRNDLLDSSVKWLPSSFYIQNYIAAAKSMDFWKTLGKGVIIAGVPTLCNVLIGMIVGYGFARYEFKLKKLFMGILLFSYILPDQVTMIPTYVLYNDMGILGTLWTFILPALFGNGINSAIFILIWKHKRSMIAVCSATLARNLKNGKEMIGRPLRRGRGRCPE